jgi:hypothetical protein
VSLRLIVSQIASRKMPFLNVDTIILLADMLVAQAEHLAPRCHTLLLLFLLLLSILHTLSLTRALNASHTRTVVAFFVHRSIKSSVDVPLILSNALIAYQTALNIQPTNTKYVRGPSSACTFWVVDLIVCVPCVCACVRCLVGVGNIHFSRRQWKDAISTYEEAIRLEVSLLPVSSIRSL